MHGCRRERRGVYGSSDLAIVAHKRSWKQKFVKTERGTQEQRIWLTSGPWFEAWVFVGPWRVLQAGSPLCPKRAALRAAQGSAPSLPAEPARNHKRLWGNLIVVHGKEGLTPDTSATCITGQNSGSCRSRSSVRSVHPIGQGGKSREVGYTRDGAKACCTCSSFIPKELGSEEIHYQCETGRLPTLAQPKEPGKLDSAIHTVARAGAAQMPTETTIPVLSSASRPGLAGPIPPGTGTRHQRREWALEGGHGTRTQRFLAADIRVPQTRWTPPKCEYALPAPAFPFPRGSEI